MVGQSLCGEGRDIRLHYYQPTCQWLLLNFGLWQWTTSKICASTERSVGPSLHPVQALKNHLRFMHGSIIFDHIGTRFLGGGGDLYARTTYTRERLIREYIWQYPVNCHKFIWRTTREIWRLGNCWDWECIWSACQLTGAHCDGLDTLTTLQTLNVKKMQTDSRDVRRESLREHW